MRSSITSYARVIVGDKYNNSMVIDISNHGEFKPTLKVVFSKDGVIKDKKDAKYKLKRKQLLESVLREVSELIEKTLIENEI